MLNRRGVALFAALALTAIVALLLAGAVTAATLAQRSSRLVATEVALDAAADYGLSTVLAVADSLGLADLPYGRTATFVVSMSESAAQITVSATRVRGSVVWLVSEASAAGPYGGRRRFNMVARFRLAGAPPLAPIVSRGNVTIGHGVVFLQDTSSDPECGGPFAWRAIVAPGARLTGRAAGGDSVWTDVESSANDSSAYFVTSRRLATLDSAPRIVHVRGDTTISGGSFVGVLVADGSVTIGGAFRAKGLIVARGRISAVAGDFSLSGAMMSFAPVASVPSIELADAIVSFAPCEVDRALRLAFSLRQVPKRGWAEIF